MKIKQNTAYAMHALMYMVRHATQMPITLNEIAKAEGIPKSCLSKTFKKLVDSKLVKTAIKPKRGYVFAKDPEEISLLELFEVVEESKLFADCFMRHCECGGTPENCKIFSRWVSSTKRMSDYLAKTSIVESAWNHPEHRFHEIPASKQVSSTMSGRSE